MIKLTLVLVARENLVLVFGEYWPFVRGLSLIATTQKLEKATNQGIP
jgi:hypothetical protein